MTRRSVAGDLCYGARAIAQHLGITPRQALGLMERGRLPFFREGRVLCARRSTLNDWLAQREAAGLHLSVGV